MRLNPLRASVLLISVFLSLFTIPLSIGQSTNTTLTFQQQFEISGYKLYVSITPLIYSFFGNLTHKISSDADYEQLVTPQAVEPIAESILNKTSYLPHPEEQFANAVLSLVHQIPYKVTDAAYPVETLVNDSADCVGLSILAASIMSAGGLDVVLIHYSGINPGHMNVGVYLPYTPVYHTLLIAPTSLTYNNKTYWTAEATSQMDWKVGDQSDTVANTQAQIIPLDNLQNLPASVHVSARFDRPLVLSSIDLTLSQQPIVAQNVTRALVASGFVSPAQSNVDITIYIYHNGAYVNCTGNYTDSCGQFLWFWNFTQTGTYYVTASWSGDSSYAGADSETLLVFVGPQFLVQFQTPNYNYIFAHDGLANYELRPYIGVNDFLSVPLGNNVSFSYDFMILPTGHEPSNVQSKTATVLTREISLRGAPRHSQNLSAPGETYVVPAETPQNLQPMSLPDDFNQTIKNSFCFIMQGNSLSNYSLNVKGFSSNDLTDIQNNKSNTIINATDSLIPNVWYTSTTDISMNTVTTKLEDANGTILIDKVYPALTNNSMVLLFGNSIDKALTFKDLNINAFNQIIQPSKKTQPSDQNNVPLADVLTMGSITLIAVSIGLYVRKKIIGKRKILSN
jgi:hypothetical protein